MAPEQRRQPGRPREFDEGRVLDAIVALFSRNGFTGASMSEIAAAADLSTGSLYKAFGDKDGIFASALARYVAQREMAIADTIGGNCSARDRIAAVLRLYASLSQGETGRNGCMVVAGIAEMDMIAAESAAALRDVLARRRALLARLVAEGQRDGSVRSVRMSAALADLLLTLTQGMRVVGKGGLFPSDAEPLIALALQVLDDRSPENER